MKSYFSKLLLSALLLAAVPAAKAQAPLFSVDCGEVTDETKAINYSLYWESFKNEAYGEAMPYLRWMISCAPTFNASSSNDRHFRRLMQAYEHFAEQASDAATRAAYLDSALVTYDAMLPIIEAAGTPVNPVYARIEKARFIQQHAEALPDRQGEVVALYREAYEMQPDSVDSYTVQYLFANLLQEGNKAAALAFAKDAKERFADDAELVAYIDNYMGVLFENDEEKFDFYKARFVENPNDEEALDIVIEIARKKKWTEELAALEPQILQRLEANPSASMYRILAGIRADAGDYSGASELYEKAIAATDDVTQKRDIWYNIGIMRHQAGNLAGARAAYNKALEFDANYGPALIGIGDTVMASACGDELTRGSVYWYATDLYQRAASRDPSVADMASSRIAGARRGYPSTETLFLKGISRGSSYPVGCGFGGTTTVR